MSRPVATGAGVPPVLSLLNGYQSTCVIMAASKLGVFEHLQVGQRTSLDELAQKLGGADPSRLRRLLRALATLGLVDWQGGSSFALTEDGGLLRGGTFGAFPTVIGAQYLAAWSNLDHSVATGEPAFPHLFGMSAWEHRRQQPKLNEAFNRMMDGFQARAVATIVDAYDFGSARRVVDVGGGNGHLLVGILTRWKEIAGVLFEQPDVVEIARPTVASVKDRLELVAGSFLEDVIPRGADIYVLQHVLHNWNDASCVTILQNCRKAMQEGARLLVLEHVLPTDEPGPRPLAMLDLHMMSIHGGSVRTLAEYDAIFERAGFRRTRHIPTAPQVSDILETTVSP